MFNHQIYSVKRLGMFGQRGSNDIRTAVSCMQDSLGDQNEQLGQKCTDAKVGQPSDENTDDEEEEDPFAFGSDAANDGEDDDSSDEEEEDPLAFREEGSARRGCTG